MITSKKELARAIRNKCSEYSHTEIMSSPYLEPYIGSVITAMCEKLGRIPELQLSYDETSDFTACTNGLRVMCNSASPTIRDILSIDKKFVSLFGLITHECGHVLYTDFVNMNPMIEGWQDGILAPIPDDIPGTDEFLEYLKDHSQYRNVYFQNMRNIQNIIEDIYIEKRIHDDFSGLCTLGLKVTRDETYRLIPDIKEPVNAALNLNTTLFAVANYILLVEGNGYKRKSNVKLSEDEENILSYVEGVLKNAEVEIRTLINCSERKKRLEMFNRLFVKLSVLMPPFPDNNSPKESGQGSSDSTDSEDSTDSTQKSTNSGTSQNTSAGKSDGENRTNPSDSGDYSDMETTEYAGQTAVPVGNSSPVSDSFDSKKAEETKEEADNQSTDSGIKNQFEKALQDLAKEEILSKEERANDSKLQKEAEDIFNTSKERGIASFDGYEINKIDRKSVSSLRFKNSYTNLYRDVEKTSKSLARKLDSILKDCNEEDEETNGHYFGTMIDRSSFSRKDCRYYKRINIPDDKKTVVFGLLIDESGSMSGQNIRKAKKAAILLDDALARIKCPHIICGHTTSYRYNKVKINVYSDEITLEENEKYRLAGIEADSNNIDGAAITYMFKKLKKMPQDRKVLIVISDGMPCGGSFYNSCADTDTKMAIEDARKQGVEVFGAVIDNYELIKNLYGDKYCFDCSDYTELEKKLCMLIKKYVLK